MPYLLSALREFQRFLREDAVYRPTLYVMLGVLMIPTLGLAQSLDQRLTEEAERLLSGYGQFKGYRDTSPGAVEATLTADRRTVFHAAVRALFTEILARGGNPSGYRLIDFVDHVTGIWGLRPGNNQGRHQFRVSLTWRPGFVSALEGSRNLPSTSGPHVLMPGGDDDPMFTSFDVRAGRHSRTHREAVDPPNIQVSYLRRDPSVGEIDIDFHGVPILCFCHCTPSNSDPSSAKRGGHSHLDDFNVRYGFFSTDLTSGCVDFDNHCEDSYGTPNCSR